MRVSSVKTHTQGWFIGDFDPTLLRTDLFEVAAHNYPKGFVGTPHIHKVATEYNCIISGRLIASGIELGPGDIFIYEPNEVSLVTFLENTDLVIVKTPSIPGDKYEMEAA